MLTSPLSFKLDILLDVFLCLGALGADRPRNIEIRKYMHPQLK